ncbi:hypothetical protein MTO96_015540 [Rhipicephalus appendiculatus]
MSYRRRMKEASSHGGKRIGSVATEHRAGNDGVVRSGEGGLFPASLRAPTLIHPYAAARGGRPIRAGVVCSSRGTRTDGSSECGSQHEQTTKLALQHMTDCCLLTDVVSPRGLRSSFKTDKAREQRCIITGKEGDGVLGKFCVSPFSSSPRKPRRSCRRHGHLPSLPL